MRNSDMMGDTGLEAAGTECTADIHIEAGSDAKRAEFPDFNLLIGSGFEDQGVGSGMCLHLLRVFKPK